jgi:Ankyrin repeats (3 copies)/Ankyrin repeat
MVDQMKNLLRESRILIFGLLFGCLFMPVLLWFLNFKHGIHLAHFNSLSIYTFYRDFYTGLDNPLVWPLLLAPYLLHSLIRLLFRSSTPQVPETSSLEQAVSGGSVETIKSVIAKGMDINAINILGQTPLHLAAENGNGDAVQLLLDNGAEVDAVAIDSGCTALHYAASLGHVDLCELLVRHGANPDAQTVSLETPLHLAVASGHSKVVALLLKYHARLDIRDKNGMTPLQQAENTKKREIVTLIRQHLSEVWPYLIISRR